ncbi:hypothetical protein [Allorhodopirellula heiligendammensis]|uniref:Uncharacterized protein n=1 Tax=Allorhodopirellula heiligendammensis TaxID=2714739 RepID=A0A5C6BYD3_9BACT|nr:hypothetical protein [Allorhodopirellula heiligendammensis]TWU16286.1 hypothetical protein Poly21_34910 [Allorhodopirellula heiligendammensis]
MTPSNENPYAPPSGALTSEVVQRPASWYLSRVQKYYRWMGFGMLSYLVIAVIVAIVDQLHYGSFRLRDAVGPLIWCLFLTWLFAAMIRIGYTAPEKFPQRYQQARWIGIIAGALFLPILGIPAFISVRRLTRYHQCLGSRDE